MRNYRLTVCLVICTLILLLNLLYTAQAQNYFQYNVLIKSDGSADWTIIQFSNANATVDSWNIFQQKIYDLVDSASTLTNRLMSVDENTLQINTTVIADSKTTEYSFTWQNFTAFRGNELLIGDVFQVPNFFEQLYGDAALQLNYPSEFTVKSVFPEPYLQQNSDLQWSRTRDLTTNPVDIVLISGSQSQTNPNNLQLYSIIIIILVAAGIVLSFVSFYILRRRKHNIVSADRTEFSLLMSEEEKVLKLLKSTGGRIRQSQIIDQLKFSKAKTSQLLGVLEKKGSITRYKNGRDKIVTLKERVKGEQL